MVYEPTTNFRDSNGVDLGKKLITQDYVSTVYPSLSGSASGFIANPAELYLWGFNDAGQLGDNTILYRSTPRQEFTSSTNWKQVSTGASYTVAIKNDGTLWSWGRNNTGQLGDNTVVNKSTPIREFTSSNNWKQVSAGSATTLAIKTDGTLWAWGSNNSGQVGDNTTANRSTPRQISAPLGGIFPGERPNPGWKQVSSGGYRHSSAVREDGTLWTWGRNSTGELGNNTIVDRLTPTQEFTSSTNWKQVSAGIRNTVAIKNNGTLWGWGQNSDGQVGDNTILIRSTPRQESTGATNWKQVSCGSHVVAIKTDGTLWSWGSNNQGQVGDNTILIRSTPRQISAGASGITGWKQVSARNSNTAAIRTDGTLWAWGQNSYGQVGDNTNSGGVTGANSRSTPRQISTGATGITGWRQIDAGLSTVAIKFSIGQ